MQVLAGGGAGLSQAHLLIKEPAPALVGLCHSLEPGQFPPPCARPAKPLQSHHRSLVVFNMTANDLADRVRAALETYVDPYLGETLAAAQAVREVRAAGAGFTARLVLGFPVGGYQAELTAALAGAARSGGHCRAAHRRARVRHPRARGAA